MLRSLLALSLYSLVLGATASAAVPASVLEALGGSVAICLYTSHTVIGQAAIADHSSEEKIKAALMAVGGTVGGLQTVQQQLQAAAKDLSKEDAAQLKVLADIVADVQKEGSFLIDALKAKNAGDKAAFKKFMNRYNDTRKVAAGEISDALDLPEEMLQLGIGD